jgi:adenylate cyclase
MPSPAQPIERKLAAIFAADVAGYSRLMGQDEVGTLRTLAARREIMDRLIGEHRGRIANTAGDSVLAEFPSVVEAVKCAVAVQELLRDENDSAPVERRLLFRIGVHVGDVMLRGADLLGDAINIAARLQSLADPGGVCISGVTHDFVRKTLPLNFDDLALQNVKNIDEPIHAYAVRLEARSATLLANAAGLKPGLAPPDRPSIAVLPFASAAADDEYLGDGIADDVTTALSKMRWLFVIARNSAFAFRGRAMEVGQIAQQLGVRYILTGSVRRSGKRARISVQLVEVNTATSLWAERYDHDLEDILALQDDIASKVAGAIEPELLKKEGQRAASRSDQNHTVWDLLRRGTWEFHKVRPESHRVARDLFLQVIAASPESADGHIWLARVDAGLVAGRWTDDPEATAAEGMAAALRAVQLDEQNPYSHYAVAITHSFAGRVERARKAAERAIALSPSFALGHLVLGLCVLLLGNPGEAIRELEHGLRLNPFDPHGFYWRLSLAFAHYIGGEPALGLEEARACLEMLPHWSAALRIAAACQIALGNRIAAHQYVAELEGEGNPGQDLLVNMAAHRPDWVQKVEAALSSVRTETRAVVGSS